VENNPFNPDSVRGTKDRPAHEKMRGAVAPPSPKLRLDKKAFAVYPFAVLWLAFALFWTYGASADFRKMMVDDFQNVAFSDIALALIFPLCGVPFILIGLWLFYKPFAQRDK